MTFIVTYSLVSLASVPEAFLVIQHRLLLRPKQFDAPLSTGSCRRVRVRVTNSGDAVDVREPANALRVRVALVVVE